MSVEQRLLDLKIVLPALPGPAGNYVLAVRSAGQLFLSAKGSIGTVGKVPSEVSVDAAYQGARETGLILLAVMRHELGSLDKVRRVVKIFGMVNADADFADHPMVINGCSDRSPRAWRWAHR